MSGPLSLQFQQNTALSGMLPALSEWRVGSQAGSSARKRARPGRRQHADGADRSDRRARGSLTGHTPTGDKQPEAVALYSKLVATARSATIRERASRPIRPRPWRLPRTGCSQSHRRDAVGGTAGWLSLVLHSEQFLSAVSRDRSPVTWTIPLPLSFPRRCAVTRLFTAVEGGVPLLRSVAHAAATTSRPSWVSPNRSMRVSASFARRPPESHSSAVLAAAFCVSTSFCRSTFTTAADCRSASA